MELSDRWKFDIFCLATSTEGDIPRRYAKAAAICYPDRYAKPVIRYLFDVQYHEFMFKATRKFKDIDDTSPIMVFCKRKYLPLSEFWAIVKNDECPIRMPTQADELPSWTQHLLDPDTISPLRDYLFFNIHFDEREGGFLVFEIFTDINPKIAGPFVHLFRQREFAVGRYRVFTDGWFEFGIGPKSMPMRGKNHHPLMTHNSRGILSFTEDQDCDAFFLHFVPCTFLDSHRTVLGRVIQGERVLRHLEELEVDGGKTKEEISIFSCGVIPIGRNSLDDDIISEDLQESLNRLFGMSMKYSNFKEGKLNRRSTLREESGMEITCSPDLLLKEEYMEMLGEDMYISENERGTLASISTVEAWKKPLKIDPLTLLWDTESSEMSVSETSSEFLEPSIQFSYSSELLAIGESDQRLLNQQTHIDCKEKEETYKKLLKTEKCPGINSLISY